MRHAQHVQAGGREVLQRCCSGYDSRFGSAAGRWASASELTCKEERGEAGQATGDSLKSREDKGRARLGRLHHANTRKIKEALFVCLEHSREAARARALAKGVSSQHTSDKRRRGQTAGRRV